MLWEQVRWSHCLIFWICYTSNHRETSPKRLHSGSYNPLFRLLQPLPLPFSAWLYPWYGGQVVHFWTLWHQPRYVLLLEVIFWKAGFCSHISLLVLPTSSFRLSAWLDPVPDFSDSLYINPTLAHTKQTLAKGAKLFLSVPSGMTYVSYLTKCWLFPKHQRAQFIPVKKFKWTLPDTYQRYLGFQPCHAPHLFGRFDVGIKSNSSERSRNQSSVVSWLPWTMVGDAQNQAAIPARHPSQLSHSISSCTLIFPCILPAVPSSTFTSQPISPFFRSHDAVHPNDQVSQHAPLLPFRLSQRTWKSNVPICVFDSFSNPHPASQVRSTSKISK